MAGGARTPASMIMAGILQVRQNFLDAEKNGDYYHAAWALAELASLLPIEAKKTQKNLNGLEIEAPPSAGEKDKITPDIVMKCRQYIERHRLQYAGAIPQYVYQYFERGRVLKRGY